jgi:hypothetical protein
MQSGTSPRVAVPRAPWAALCSRVAAVKGAVVQPFYRCFPTNCSGSSAPDRFLLLRVLPRFAVDLLMADTFADKLAALGFAIPDGHLAPTEKLVRAFERRFGLKLPADFRSFLVCHGGAQGTAISPMIEPTPFGTSTIITGFYGFHDEEIGETTDLIEGAPEIIALGTEGLGRMFWLFCAEPYFGHIFVRDHYGRSSWTDEEFFNWPHLAPEIRLYLDLRRKGKLPKKPEGFEDVYLVARSFTEFIDSLQPYNDDEQDPVS